jgi:hypothetical protein
MELDDDRGDGDKYFYAYLDENNTLQPWPPAVALGQLSEEEYTPAEAGAAVAAALELLDEDEDDMERNR